MVEIRALVEILGVQMGSIHWPGFAFRAIFYFWPYCLVPFGDYVLFFSRLLEGKSKLVLGRLGGSGLVYQPCALRKKAWICPKPAHRHLRHGMYSSIDVEENDVSHLRYLFTCGRKNPSDPQKYLLRWYP